MRAQRPSSPWRAAGIVVLIAVISALHAHRAGAQQAAKPLTLDDCIALGLANQPAVVAANASLAAAEDGYRALQRMVLAQFFVRDLGIRKQQACLGIEIALAGVQQAEWETRYAITRNYYSVLYARKQLIVVNGIVDSLTDSAKKAKEFLDLGDPKIPITKIDVDTLVLNRDLVMTKVFEAQAGIDKAKAALREAMGLKREQAFDIAEGSLPALVENLDAKTLVDLALERRAELVQAHTASTITQLEVAAQGKTFRRQVKTFASGADLHARPIPTGEANGDYRPGAIGLEMPPMLAGRKGDRIARAYSLSVRAGAVVDKTENLIVLEAEATFLKWREAAAKMKVLKNAPALAKGIADNVQKRFFDKKASPEELLRTQTQVSQTQAQYNEAEYQHALALAALERVTAGGFLIAKR